MKMLEIVSCWIDRTVAYSGDVNTLRRSFAAAGFREVSATSDTWRFKRGAAVGLTFNYGSEALEVQVYLKKLDGERVRLSIGNWGFPFEPFLAKKRFTRLADRFARDIEESGKVQPTPDEATVVSSQASWVKRAAVIALCLTALIAARVLGLL